MPAFNSSLDKQKRDFSYFRSISSHSMNRTAAYNCGVECTDHSDHQNAGNDRHVSRNEKSCGGLLIAITYDVVIDNGVTMIELIAIALEFRSENSLIKFKGTVPARAAGSKVITRIKCQRRPVKNDAHVGKLFGREAKMQTVCKQINQKRKM